MQNGAIDSPSFYYNLRRGRIAVHGLLMLFAEKYEKYFGRSLFIKRKFLSVLLALSLVLSLLPTAALAEEAPADESDDKARRGNGGRAAGDGGQSRSAGGKRRSYVGCDRLKKLSALLKSLLMQSTMQATMQATAIPSRFLAKSPSTHRWLSRTRCP